MGISAQDLLTQLRAEKQQSGSVDAKTLLEQLRAERRGKPLQQQALETVGREARGALDAAITIGGGALGAVAGGLHGAYDLLTGQGVSKAASDIQSTQEAFTRTPSTPEGQRDVAGLGHAYDTAKRGTEAAVAGGLVPFMGTPDMQTAREVFQQGAGDTVLERTGSPALATLANMGVDVALLAPQLRGLLKPGTSGLPRTKLTVAERDLLNAIERDRTPEVAGAIRSGATKREAQIEALREAEQEAINLGPGTVAADVAGANTRIWAKVQGAISSTGKKVREDVINRSNSVRDRMAAVLEDTLFKGRTLEKATLETEAKMRSGAVPLYQEFYASPVNVTPGLVRMLKEPIVSDAIPYALKLLKAEKTITAEEAAAGMRGLTRAQKINARRMFKTDRKITDETSGVRKRTELSSEGAESSRRSINMERIDPVGLDYLKRGMDSHARRVSKKDEQLAGAMKGQAASLRDAIVEGNAVFGDALNVWSSGKTSLESVEAGSNAFKQLASGAKSAETLMAEFEKLNATDKALYRIGAADHLRSTIRLKPDTKTGDTPASVYTAFAGSPASRDLLGAIFENADDFGKFSKLIERENAYNQTLKTVNVGDDIEASIQNLYSTGDLAQQIARMSTDALFAASGNRFATLNLIQNAVLRPRQFLSRFHSAESARLALGQEAQTTIREMLNVLEAKRAVNGPAVNGMMKKMWRITKMPPNKMYHWLKDEKHRRQLYALGTAAVVAEQHGAESNGK